MLPTSEKMAGYLEKKSKMRVVCRWKKLWFVLEGRLLLYYKSQLEYLSLSPCRGTVNLGLAASVSPGKSNEIIVSTRSHTVSLRALNKGDHDVWLQALIDAMCLPNANHSSCCAKPVHHFRYSTGVLEESEKMLERAEKLGQAHTLSARIGSSYPRELGKTICPNSRKNVIYNNTRRVGSENELENSKSLHDVYNSVSKNNNSDSKFNSLTDNGLDKLSKKFCKIAVSDTSIPGKFRLTSSDEKEREVIRRSASVENDLVRFSENIYESVKELDIDVKEVNPKKKKIIDSIKRSDSDRIISRHGKMRSEFRSEQIIKSSCDDSPLLKSKGDRRGFSLRSNNNKEKILDNFLFQNEKRTDNFRSKVIRPSAIHENNMKRFHNKDIKSDTDLSIKRHYSRQSGSCDSIPMNRVEMEPIRKMIESARFSEELNRFRAKMLKDEATMKTPVSPVNKPTRAKRSNSLLRRFSRESSKESYDSGVDTGSTPKKRSLSFLKKMWKKKDKRWDTEDESFSINPDPLEETHRLPSAMEKEDSFHCLGMDNETPQPEPPPDYDEVNVSEDEPPRLPPRRHWVEEKRPPSPWHDVPTNNQPVVPPALPAKRGQRQNLDFLFHDDSTGLRFLFREETSTETEKSPTHDLGDMLAKISEINMAPLETFHYFADDNSLITNDESIRRDGEDPDYDVPRPHASLLANLRKQSATSDTIPATHFFSHFEDSLDPAPCRDEFDQLTMAPDSLECDPWSLSNETDIHTETWAKYAMTTNTISIEPTGVPFSQESLYQDSLNTTINNNKEDCLTYQKGFLKLYS